MIKDFDIEEDAGFNFKEEKIRRISWVILALVLVMALVGFWGNGLLSSRSITTGNCRLSYDYFLRLGRSSELNFRIGTKPSEKVKVSISRDYFKSIELESILPFPLYSTSDEYELSFFFNMPAQTDHLYITFSTKPKKTGKVHASISYNNDSIQFSHFIYP
jgi:hypothetical protein